MLFLDGVYVDHLDGSVGFRRVDSPTSETSVDVRSVPKAGANNYPLSVCSRELFLNKFVLETYSKIAVTQISRPRVSDALNGHLFS